MAGLIKSKEVYAGEIPDDLTISQQEFEKDWVDGDIRKLTKEDALTAFFMINKCYSEIFARGFKALIGMWILQQVFYKE